MVGDVCVTGGVVHGLPEGPLHGDALGKTDQLLEAVGNHVVFGCRRPRYVAGDWSHDMSQLSTLRAWEKAGFRDLQTIAFERWCFSIPYVQIGHEKRLRLRIGRAGPLACQCACE